MPVALIHTNVKILILTSFLWKKNLLTSAWYESLYYSLCMHPIFSACTVLHELFMRFLLRLNGYRSHKYIILFEITRNLFTAQIKVRLTHKGTACWYVYGDGTWWLCKSISLCINWFRFGDFFTYLQKFFAWPQWISKARKILLLFNFNW